MDIFWRMLPIAIPVELLVAGLYFAFQRSPGRRPWWGRMWLVLLANLITLPPLLLLMPYMTPNAPTIERQAGFLALAASLAAGLLLVFTLRSRTRSYQMLFLVLTLFVISISCLVFTIMMLGFSRNSESVSSGGLPFWLALIVVFIIIVVWEALLITGLSNNDLRFKKSFPLSLVMNTCSFLFAMILAVFLHPQSPAKQLTSTAIPTSTPTSLSISIPTLAAPVSDLPAAGICADFKEDIVTAEIWPDIPSPRCVKVLPNQRVQVTNRTDALITARLAGLQVEIPAGETVLIPNPLGEILAPGVHQLEVTGGSAGGPEIWLVTELQN